MKNLLECLDIYIVQGIYVYVEKQVDQEEGTINYLMKIDRKTLKKVKEIKVNHSEDESVFFYSDDKNSLFFFRKYRQNLVSDGFKKRQDQQAQIKRNKSTANFTV